MAAPSFEKVGPAAPNASFETRRGSVAEPSDKVTA
jgi:hypothetical protein